MDNFLSGSLPSSSELSLPNLEKLFLANNGFGGNIPQYFSNFSNLVIFYAGNNQLSGPIPLSLGSLKNLRYFAIQSNQLTGETYGSELGFLSALSNCQSLQTLVLEENPLRGSIPESIKNFSNSLQILFAPNCQIRGHIPNQMGFLKSLTFLHSIQELKSLSSLNLSRNSFQGSIPQSIGNLKGLDFLDLSYNELSGPIPNSMEGLPYLQNLNLSFNKLSGEIPNGGPFGNFSALSFTGNEALCGNATFQVPPCKVNEKKSSRDKRLRLLYIILPVVSAMLLVPIIYLLRKHGNATKKTSVLVENLPGIDHPMISYQELCSGTNDFSESNLLGVGSFSSVYKGTLANGMDVAVKVLNLHIEGSLRSFDVECEVFRKIWHRNLVKVISTCTNADLRALVLQYVPNGSLEKWLYSNNYNLGLHQRVKIMVDVATTLDYLHHGQSEPVVHCDLKPSNVLLNKDLVAQVCDFGIAKILAKNKLETQTRTLSTIGYIAPAYGLEGKVSTKGDVYSFGILLLEVITGKKPTSEMFDADMSLRRWVGAAIPERVLDVVDSKLLNMNHEDMMLSKVEWIVLSILELGLECSKDLSEERMDMETIMVKLNKIKLSLP
ncbi:hypothetical protein BT93_L0208 [Corymbia citriodora subsp. variegata]|uniref:non-specific serine/threonine protein kinase n=1 Tax=Corymbia citriodora subsp. variegata TaxID=360336 RepID=A0A8T0CQC5_CORYI|nr:hypothetical protein BT93_L0208 [Corymbia citriodora subsp. variegata]